MIYFTSDLHFCHDKEFLYKPRGFNSVDEMNEAIVEKWNSTVWCDDDVYVLGDLMLCDNDKGSEYLKRLNGRIHIILGNHDTNTRILIYDSLPNVVSVAWGYKLKYEGITFFLSHYPCITENTKIEPLNLTVFSLHGHTHSKELFNDMYPYAYNVALDAHDNTPVSAEQVKKDIVNRYHTLSDSLKI